MGPENTPSEPLDLYEFALSRAQESARKRELLEVAEGSGLGHSWLTKFARGLIPGASYAFVKQLADYYKARDAAQMSAGQQAEPDGEKAAA